MKLLELLEDDARDLVVIYPGRFHPFHIGHGKVYKYLKQKYSNAKVFISTSGKTDGDRSPFTFEEKKKMMMLAGVDSNAIVQSKSPYQSPEITEMFDPDKTVVVFAVSEKDMENEPRFDFSNGISFKKNGEPAHMQKWEGMESADTVRKHSYIATTPTFPFTIRGAEISSASQIRNMISKSDDTELRQILQDLYNVADIPQDVMDIFKRKIGNSTMNENWNEDLTSEFLIEDNTMSTSILKALTESGFSAKQIKMAFGILNDPRYKQGNYSGAVEAIEKVAKGLSEHPSVANALKRANEGFMATVGQGIDNLAVGAGKLVKKGAKKAAPHVKKAAKDLGNASVDATKKGLKKLSKIGSKNTSYDVKTGKTNTTYGMANAKNESVATDIKDYIDDHKEHFDAYPMDVEIDDKIYDWDAYWAILDKAYPGEYPKFESVKESVDESDIEKMQKLYKYNEDRNAHSENIHMLAQAFGDRDEIKAIEGLLKITKRQGYVTPEQSEVMYNSIHKPYIKKLFPIEASNEGEEMDRPYICVHAVRGKTEVYAPSSHKAAKEAAAKWGLKSTAGIDAYLADVEHVAEHKGGVKEAVGEFADPIYDLIDDLGASDNHPVLNDLVRYLDGDTIKDFVADFRRNNDLNHPGEDGDYGEDDKNFESKQVKEHGYANEQHEQLEYIHHVLQECGDGNVDNAMVDQAIGFVEDIREQHFNADGSTKSESIKEGKDYNLIAQRKTMNLSDQAIIALIASLYKQLDDKELSESQGYLDTGNIAGYLDTIDEYVEKLFKIKYDDMLSDYPKMREYAYRIQNAVDDIRTREFGMKPSLIRAKYNKELKESLISNLQTNPTFRSDVKKPFVVSTHNNIKLSGGTPIKKPKMGNPHESIKEDEPAHKYADIHGTNIKDYPEDFDIHDIDYDELNVCDRCGDIQRWDDEMYWKGEEDSETNEILGDDNEAVCDRCYGELAREHKANKQSTDESPEMHISPDIARAKTLQHTLPSLDREKYQERDGLEGPIMTKSGKVVYYDPIEGSYYDPDTDIYLSYEEWKELSEAVDFFAETVTMLAMNDGIMHYSDAKGTPKYSEGYKAAKDGVKYDENPYRGAEKLQWSKGHNDWRADELASKGEPNYGARGQFESDVESDIYAQDTMKDELPDEYKNYPSHLADLEADEIGVSAEDLVDIITHRIKMNKELMLSLLGDEGPGPLMRAIEEIADFYRGTTEVGSSDVSAMVTAVVRSMYPLDYHKWAEKPYGKEK